MMLAGRFIFGLGAETSYVAQNKVMVYWFQDKEMALAMGLGVSAGRMGTLMTFTVIPATIRHFGYWQASLYLAALVAFFEFVCIIAYIIMEKAAESKLGRKVDLNLEDSAMSFKDILHFPRSFWMFAFVVCFFYAALFPFESTATSLLQSRYHFTKAKAADVVSILPFIALVLTPIFGFIVGKVGHRVSLGVLGLAIMVAANAMMFATNFYPVPCIIVIGVAFALVPAAIWPCLPLIIDEQLIGTAFGLIQSIDNAGMLFSYYAQGLVKFWFNGNAVYGLMFFTSLLVFSFLMSIVWWIEDYRKGGVLSKVYTTSHPKSLSLN